MTKFIGKTQNIEKLARMNLFGDSATSKKDVYSFLVAQQDAFSGMIRKALEKNKDFIGEIAEEEIITLLDIVDDDNKYYPVTLIERLKAIVNCLAKLELQKKFDARLFIRGVNILNELAILNYNQIYTNLQDMVNESNSKIVEILCSLRKSGDIHEGYGILTAEEIKTIEEAGCAYFSDDRGTYEIIRMKESPMTLKYTEDKE